jgi:hypothetical protein
MKELSLLSLLLVGSAIAACAVPSADATDTSLGAASTEGATLASAHFDGIDLLVTGGRVSGHYYGSAGPTCEFTFTSAYAFTVHDGKQRASVFATDGVDTVTGVLTAEAGSAHDLRGAAVSLRLDGLSQIAKRASHGSLGYCLRVTKELGQDAGVRGSFLTALEPDVYGYRTVAVERTSFYDRPSGARRAVWMVRGDTLVSKGAPADGFIKASLDAETGFVPVAELSAGYESQPAGPSDLGATPAPKPAPKPPAPNPGGPVAQGEAAVVARGCGSCHTTSAGLLAGGTPLSANVRSVNLTPDVDTGLGGPQWTDDVLVRAILHGKDDVGAQLCAIMPVWSERGMGESEARAIVAYLRSIPAVPNALPENVRSGGECKKADAH